MKNHIVRTVLLCIALFCLFACENIADNTGEKGIPVKAVRVDPETAEVQPGLTRQFAASVEGEGEDLPDQAVTWSIAGDKPAGAAIDSTGFLALPENAEPDTTFTIRATSLADTSKHGSAVVTVVAPPPVAIPVKRVVVNPETAEVQPGQTQRFSAIVEGEGEALPDQRVVWSIAEDSPAGAAIDATGLFTLPANAEPGATFTIRATSSADNSKHGSAVVTVTAPPPPAVPVRRVLVSPRTASVQQGLTQQFSEQVEGAGTETPGQSVTWSIIGEHHPETIVDGGLLTVSVGETADTVFTLRATSVEDSTKYGSATVTVLEAPAIESIAIEPAETTVAQGGVRSFGAYIMVKGNASKTVVWELVAPDGKAEGTTMNPSTGVLTVAGDEQTGRVFTIRVRSVFDPSKTAEGTVTVAENMPLPSLTGSCWFWPSLQLYFISSDRVMLYSVGGYYPYQGSPFQYNYPAQGYAYSYTYDSAKKTGYIKDMGEYSGGDLLAFEIPPDNQDLYFPNYKSYGHSANFTTLRPAPAGGYTLAPLPGSPSAANMTGTLWKGEISGTDFGGIAPGKHPVFIYFDTAAHAYITRTYDVDTTAEKLREFSYTCVDGTGTINNDVGTFTVQSAANTLTFTDFPAAYNPNGDPPDREAVVFSRISY
jgi:uncharacterized protein YjdB